MEEQDNNLRNLVFILIAVAVAVVFIFLGQRKSKELEELRKQKQRLVQEREKLQKKKRELTIRRKRLKDDPYLIRRLARDRLGLVIPGEKQLILEEPQPLTTEPIPDTSPLSPPRVSPDTPDLFKD